MVDSGMFRSKLQTLAFVLMVTQSLPITIDNDIVGEPDIECLAEEIRIWVKTRKPFAGRIYAKGKADVEECSKDEFTKERTKKPHFDLQFGACGMKSLRSVDPRGMYYGITIVVSFHPLFITKVDQAFHVKCFFEEANHGLTAELGVSMIPTTEVNGRHGIPGCSYSIHKSSIDDLDQGKPAGPPIQFARIGDRVLHQWHCNDKMFGVLINNCYVTDGFGKKADVVNDKGCPVDPILITGIRYSADLQRAYAESSVFKFADKPGVWFFCQIQMCMKKSGMCNGITPPACATTASPIEEREDGYPLSSGPAYPPSVPPLDELTYPEPTLAPPKTTTSSYDYFENKRHNEYAEYPEENKHRKLHNPVYVATPSSDYDQQIEAVTVFGPAFSSSESERNRRVGTKVTTTSVSQSYETEEHPTTIKSAKFEKSDYNDYDDVTIPPNLSDLLAHLPDDVSPETLQKMLRDSVDDGRSLMEGVELLKKQLKKLSRHSTRAMRELRAGDLRTGEKIDQLQVDWMLTRRRDEPLTKDGSPSTHVVSSDVEMINNDKPMISGQLLIFELDEEPPEVKAQLTTSSKSILSSSSCAISRSGLFFVAGGLSVACGALFIAVLTMFFKLNKIEGECSDEIKYNQHPNRFIPFGVRFQSQQRKS